MTELLTKVKLPKASFSIDHSSRMMSLGSCFSEGIGERLARGKFSCDINPFGILYNSYSIAKAIDTMVEGHLYDEDSPELFSTGDGWWHSFMHHSRFSAPTKEECLRLINGRLQTAIEELPKLDVLLVTLGTAYTYSLKDRRPEQLDGYAFAGAVANCHKLPEKLFVREMQAPLGVVESLSYAFERLAKANSKVQVLLTVSPIRYVRDGFHDSQLSKASLLLGVDELCRKYPNCSYFPAYEILLDELRDYRFYADDMLHPSALAVDYIWEYFCQTYLTKNARDVMAECQGISRALEHRPFHPDSEQYKNFLTQITLKIGRLMEKCPTLDFKKELELCRTRLKQ